ncbi:MAG TPA: glycosyltransferase family A protein [Gemmatimonadota bacterium]|nr:glycosyltransferase family A protein [Gemmatimonadota bacterium]
MTQGRHRHVERVSVIMPFYDTRPEFMREAIESVLSQTFRDWRLLLVDDGSAEGSSSVARSYASIHDAKVIYLEHPGHRNRGQSASRNLAIEHARGEYLAFLDADDIWLPHVLEEQVGLLTAHPEAGMLYGNTLYWHSWSGDPASRDLDYVPYLGIPSGTVVDPPRLVPLLLGGKAAVPCPSAVTARRAAVEQVGGFVESAPRPNEDQFFFAKMGLHFPVLVSDRCWTLYRQHAGSVSGPQSAVYQRENRNTYLNWLDSYMLAHGMDDHAVRSALSREHWKLRHPASARIMRIGRRLVLRTLLGRPKAR